jgi:phosphotriesterase-related protein
VHDLEVALAEGLPSGRVAIGGLDRRDAVAAGAAFEVARRGAFVAIDHVGSADDVHVTDAERAALVADLVDAGHADRVLLSSDAVGYAVGHAPRDLPFDHVLGTFAPLLLTHGLGDEDIQRILARNPRDLLTGR